MPDAPADANPAFSESEADFTAAEGTSIVPAQVRVRIMSLRQTSDFRPSRVPPRRIHVVFVTFAVGALNGHKT